MYLPAVSLLLLAYLAFLLTGIVREDDLCGKIRNKELVAGAKAALAAAACYLAASVAGLEFGAKGGLVEPFLTYSYYAALLVNAAIGMTAGVVLWKTEVWPAGDAKLFTLACGALPLIIPYAPWSPWVLFLTLLVNIFTPAAAVYLVRMCRDQLRLLAADGLGQVWKKTLEQTSGVVEKARKNPGMIGMFLFTMVLFSSISAWNAAQTGSLKINDSLFFILLLAFGGKVSAYLAKAGARVILLCAAALAACAALSPAFLGLTQIVLCGLTRSVQFMVFRGVLYMVADMHLASCGTYRISLGELRPGMIVSGEYVEQLKEAYPAFADGWIPDKYRDGLTNDQVDRLSAFLKNKGQDESEEMGIPVFRVKPFAFWIVLGIALTIALSGRNILVASGHWLSLLSR